MLQKHWHDVHAKDQEECQICGEKITIGRPYVRHMRRSHMKECSVIVKKIDKATFKHYLEKLKGLETQNSLQPKSDPLKDAKSVESPSIKAPSKVINTVAQPSNNKDLPVDGRNRAEAQGKKKLEVFEVDGEKVIVQADVDEDEEDESGVQDTSKGAADRDVVELDSDGEA